MKPKEKTKLMLVDAESIFTEGIKLMLEKGGFIIIGEAVNTKQALGILKKENAGVMLTGISLKDDDGVDLIKKTKKLYPEMKVIVLSRHNERNKVIDAFRAGANGYLLKNNIKCTELISCIYKVIGGNSCISDEISIYLTDHLGADFNERILTERELEILKLISLEFTNPAIADKLHISIRTVETHRKNIYKKTATNNTAGLVKYALANKLI